MTEPDPIYSFSIPSLADDLPLKCRVYHPVDLDQRVGNLNKGKGALRGAIIAHPYAPLGGCYDDHVVLSLTESLLEQGFVVGTFNFRGAADSEGHTTWTGKAEQDDYISVAGFMVYYLHQLGHSDDPYQLQTIPSVSNGNATPPTGHSHQPIPLLLGGYSYGSLILARLPPISTIIDRFEAAEKGTAGGEIILRARTLAKQTIGQFQIASPTSPRGRQLNPDDATTSPSKRIGVSPMTVGGEETDPSARRRSRDSRRSGDFVRMSIEAPQRIKARVTGAKSAGATHKRQDTASTQSTITAARPVGPTVLPRYLVISPVLLPFSHTLCPPGPPSLLTGLRRQSVGDSHVGDVFLENTTLTVFGSSDSFTASRRLKAWAERNAKDSKSSFEWEEITGAGHFWAEEGVMQALRKRIADWILTQ